MNEINNHKQKKTIRPTTIFLILIIVGLFIRYSDKYNISFIGEKKITHEFNVMGTTARIVLDNNKNSIYNNKELVKIAEDIIRQVDLLMSPYNEHSDIYKINHSKKQEWISVNPLTWNVIMEALRWNRLSGGSFDPTVSKLKTIFSFNNDELINWVDENTLKNIQGKIGAEKILFKREGMLISLSEEGVELDLSAIAKGYAADLAANELLKNGVENVLIDVGGELRLLGAKTNEDNSLQIWKTGLQDPRKNHGEIIQVLEKTNCAIATSGDYEQFFTYQGKKFFHIFDPKTKLPISQGIISATVIHPNSCMQADALATTICVMGEENTKKFLKDRAPDLFKNGLEVIFITINEQEKLQKTVITIDNKGKITEEVNDIH